MSDGQLKKRQLERLMLLYKNTKMPVFLNLARNVEADIDEAKKDLMPEVCPSCWLYGGCNAKTSKANDCLLAKFEKWFGDST